MTNLRSAIEQGADVSLVNEWLADAEKDRDAARRALAEAEPAAWSSRLARFATISLVRGGQGTFSDLRDVDWCCLIPASFVQFADILLTNC